MNWMDDGENRNNTKPINFKAIDVDYNISLAEAIQLSVEKSGYEAEIIKKDDVTAVVIKIPFLFTDEKDNIMLLIHKRFYTVGTIIAFRKPNTLEEKLAILEYVNDNDNVGCSWKNTDKQCYLRIVMNGSRLDYVDKELEWGRINIELGNAQVDDDEELMQEKLALRERISVYQDEDLEFNLSGKWNATHGYEYKYMLDDINRLIRLVQEERENILRFI